MFFLRIRHSSLINRFVAGLFTAAVVFTIWRGLPLSFSAEINQVKAWVAEGNLEALNQVGPEGIPILVKLYESSDPKQRATIARTFYRLGRPSAAAKRVLLKDIRTSHADLRLQVQWALGRVSDDPDVVEYLLNNMQHDSNPLFRDKAACALAHDQIHLSERQKVRLYEGLIQALRDRKPDVRRIALLALQIQTGQTKNYDPNSPLAQREERVRDWERWLEQYKSNL